MASVNGGYLVAKALKNEGVDTVFTLTGGHIMPILNALVEFGIKVIDCRHECAAAYAADAYAKVSGRPGVLITTAGPGVTNTMTAMAEASETTVPIVHIGGAAVQSFFDMGMMQDVNTLGAMSAFCKFAKKVTIPRRIPEYIAMAFRHALDDTPGPVYLEMPMDILAEKYGGLIEDEGKIYYPEKYRTDAIPFGDPDLIKEAAKLLASAKKPVLVLGEQARFNTKYGEYVERLVNYLKMPVFISPLALIRGTYADESKNELFAIGNAATTQADVILELCANNHGLLGYARAPLFNAAAKIIQVHPDRLKIGYNTKADVGIVAGAGAASKQLLEEIEKLTQARKDDAWVDEARKLNGMARSFYTEAAADNGSPIHPGRLAAEVAKFLAQSGQDWHIACDGGDSGVWMAANAVARYPGQILRFGNMGTIGTGPGMTIGGWAADKKPVLYYTGDGSFGFYSMEFDTMIKQGIPVVCVISNDSAWGMIKISEHLKAPEYIKAHGHHSANVLDPARAYEKIAAAWGGIGIRAAKIEEVIPAIERIWKSGKPGILNVDVDGTKYSPATAAFAGVSTAK